MKLFNPNYQPPTSPLDAAKTAIENWFAANTSVESVTFDQLRAFLKNNGYPNADKWTNGQIHEQLGKWGYEVRAD